MQRITVTMTTAKGVVLKKTLTKPEGQPIQLSLPPGTQISVDVQGPPSKAVAPGKSTGVHKIVSKREGQDLVFEGDGEKLVTVSHFYATKDVSVGSTHWDWTEPPADSLERVAVKESAAASPSAAPTPEATSATATTEVASGAAVTAGGAKGGSGMSPVWGVVLLAGLGAGGGGGGAAAAAAATSGASTTSTVISGVITAGPVLSSHDLVVALFAADGSQLGTAAVDASGHYSFDLGTYAGVVIAKAFSNGSHVDFKDEATGLPTNLDAPLTAVASVGPGAWILNINPLTTIAGQKAGLDSSGAVTTNLDANAVIAANAAVAKAFGLSGDVAALPVIASVDASNGIAANPNAVGALLAAISGMTLQKGGQQNALNTLVQAVGHDGSLSTQGLAQLLDGAKAADPLSVNPTTGTISKMVTDLLNAGLSAKGYGIDPINATNTITSTTFQAGDSLSGKVTPGTALTDLAIQLGASGTPSAQGITLDTTTWTWQYTLTSTDIQALEGGLTQNKSGPECISLLVGGAPKAVLWTHFQSPTDAAPLSVALLNGVLQVPENADTQSGLKVADIVIVDPDGYRGGVPTLSGPDAAMFEVKAGSLPSQYELWLKSNAVLNHDQVPQFSVTVTAMGVSSAPFWLSIADVNYAPVALANAQLSTIDEDTAAPSGATISSLLLGSYSNAGHDAQDTFKGIAIRANAVTPAQGTWQWSSDGLIWNDIASAGLSDAHALYLQADAKLRFLPALNYNGKPGALSMYVVDSSGPALSSGSKVDVTLHGGTTSFSANVVDLSTSVTPVNDAPVILHPLADQLVVTGDASSQSFTLPSDAFADVDSTGLTYSAAAVTNGVAGALPSWLTFNNTSLQFTTTNAPVGVTTVRVTVSDGALATSSDFVINAVSTLSSLNTPQLQLMSDTGTSATDRLTNNGKVLVNGLVLGTNWQYSLDNGSTWLNGSGNSFDLPAQDGTYQLKVKQIYRTLTSAQGSLTVQLDTTLADPTIAGFDELGKTSDGIVTANLTDIVGTGMTHTAWGTQALLEGTTEAGATVTFLLAGQTKTAVANSSGYWNYRLSATDFANVGIGAEQITITSVTDKAGNVNHTPVTRQVTFNAIADTVSHADVGYGSDYVDALVYGNAGWNGATLTYCFTPGVAGTTEWTDAEKLQMRSVFDAYEHICNLRFVEGISTNSIYTQTSLELTKTDASHWLPKTGVLGSFYIPGDGYNGWYGSLDGYFNYDTNSWKTSLTPGGDAYYTVIHELGHALGMHHPFDDTQKFPGVVNTLDLGTNNLNQGIWSVMSYSPDWKVSPQGHTLLWGEAKTPMTFDVATMQTLYGANMQYKTGDDTYVLPSSEVVGTGWECIWDAGGNDTLTDEGATSDCVINLNAYPKTGGVPSEGYVSYNSGAKIAGGFTIADGVTIENAIGGNGNDILVGNAANNQLTGNAGNDTLTGGAGADTFVFNTALGPSNVDTITDFTASEGDKIQLSAGIFSHLTPGPALGAGQFMAGAGVTAATDPHQLIVYNTTTGNLYYDSDGNGSAAAVLFAVLQSKPTDLTVNQFTVI